MLKYHELNKAALNLKCGEMGGGGGGSSSDSSSNSSSDTGAGGYDTPTPDREVDDAASISRSLVSTSFIIRFAKVIPVNI